MAKIKDIVLKLSFVKALIKYDHEFTNSFHDFVFSHKILCKFFYFIRITTNLVGGVLFFALLLTNLPKLTILKILSAWAFAEVLVELVLKRYFARLRPESQTRTVHIGPFTFTTPKSYSFPSGHSFHAGFFTTIAVLYHLPYTWLIALLSSLVAISRVALGFHYFIDIFTGILIGIAVAVLTTMF